MGMFFAVSEVAISQGCLYCCFLASVVAVAAEHDAVSGWSSIACVVMPPDCVSGRTAPAGQWGALCCLEQDTGQAEQRKQGCLMG
jgi:hypothetical protein